MVAKKMRGEGVRLSLHVALVGTVYPLRLRTTLYVWYPSVGWMEHGNPHKFSSTQLHTKRERIHLCPRSYLSFRSWLRSAACESPQSLLFSSCASAMPPSPRTQYIK